MKLKQAENNLNYWKEKSMKNKKRFKGMKNILENNTKYLKEL